MDGQNKNLVLATALSFLVILVWFILFPPPDPSTVPDAPATAQTAEGPAAAAPGTAAPPAGPDGTAVAAVADSPRIAIETPRLAGSISLLGGRIDDLKLTTYRETTLPGSDLVRLLSPVGQDAAYYAVFGYAPGGDLGAGDVPGIETLWTRSGDGALAPGRPVTLTWDNGRGLTFTRTISVDERFMFTVTDAVANTGAAPATLQPYGLIARYGQPPVMGGFSVVHQGVVRRIDGELSEIGYADMPDLDPIANEGAPGELVAAATDGWIGFTDHYWMTTLIPAQGEPFTSVVKYVPGAEIYQTETRRAVLTVAPGATVETSTRLFAGAKEWETIRAYERDGRIGAAEGAPIAGFIDSIDWGWFFFLTKPIFRVLHWLHGVVGNMGLAIIGLTFILKVLVLPLAYKSYVSMARMKELQPEMEAIKERAGEDRQRMQREMMQLYKDRKVNPAAGCLPILIQIPIFFSLYKVISVTIELRHAPFVGWLNDLSAPDPSSLFNLFGLLPWAAPMPGTLLHLIFIGVLPILLGVSMWLQQKLNPAPTDPVQASIFAWMPWVFMFMLGGFASGLVLYWITNNLITFVQQYVIMRSHGADIDLFGNIKASVRRKPVTAAPAAKAAPPARSAPAEPAAPKPAAPKPAAPKAAAAKRGPTRKSPARK